MKTIHHLCLKGAVLATLLATASLASAQSTTTTTEESIVAQQPPSSTTTGPTVEKDQLDPPEALRQSAPIFHTKTRFFGGGALISTLL